MQSAVSPQARPRSSSQAPLAADALSRPINYYALRLALPRAVGASGIFGTSSSQRTQPENSKPRELWAV